MKLMIRAVRRHLGMFLTAVLFLCLETTSDLLQPTMMSYIVDNGVKGADLGAILRYGAVMFAIAAMGAVGAVVRNLYASRTSQLIGKELRSEIYRKVQALSFENIDRLQSASIITRITNDVTQIQNFINASMRVVIKMPVTCIGAVLLIVFQTPRQTPMMVCILLVGGGLIACNMKLGYPRFGFLQTRLDKLNDVSREFLSSIRVVKAFGAEGQEEEKFSSAAVDLADAGTSALRVMAVFSPFINLTVNLGIIVLLWLSGSQDAAHIGKLMASVNYMTQVLFSLSMVSNILNSAVRAVASSERVEEILSEEPAQRLPDRPAAPEIRGGVTFEGVTFTYAGSARPAVEDVSFTAAPGETVGIIGATGSGKTSLVNLVPRFYDATGGRVLVDGCDVTTLDLTDLRQAVAVVPQKALLFSGAIAENLHWGDPGADLETLRAAARAACADDFISGFPEGYETELGQGGVNLSGGQKQRLCIARALLRRPKVLILDDCTSALDASTESAVLSALRAESAGMTVLLISQRVSTVMRSDRVLCLEDGKLVGFGPHQALLESCPAYRAIYDSQIGGDGLG